MRNKRKINKYEAVHNWLRKNYGKASCCENKKCPKTSKPFQWALKNKCRYGFNRKSFIQLCAKCHSLYDHKYKRKHKRIDTNVRFWEDDRLLIKKMAKKENRTLKGEVSAIVQTYYLKYYLRK